MLKEKSQERVECSLCGTEVLVCCLVRHQESTLCKNRSGPDSSNRLIRCLRCGDTVTHMNENNHKLFVGCFKKYLSMNPERPYTKFDDWLETYIEKRRSKSKPVQKP